MRRHFANDMNSRLCFNRLSFVLFRSNHKSSSQRIRPFSVKELPWCAAADSPNRIRRRKIDFLPIRQFGVVAAVSTNGIIGKNGKTPWRIPEDRDLFVSLTRNKILVIGRRTWEEVADASHIQHAKHCIVISNTLHLQSEATDKLQQTSVVTVKSFAEALHFAREIDESSTQADDHGLSCWVAGGEDIYREAVVHPCAVTVHLSKIHRQICYDSFTDNVARFPSDENWANRFGLFDSQKFDKFTHFEYKRLR